MTVDQSTEIFYVTSHGVAGDHWFEWFSRALNAHPDMYIYYGESKRAKYMEERSRKERPDIFDFTQFLIDLGSRYDAAGETYAYRSYQIEPLQEKYDDQIRFVNLVRHPYCWINSYSYWRTINMNMPADNTLGIDHEWNVTCHDEIQQYDLKDYTRDDPEIWSSYQAMIILNRMLTDLNPGVTNFQIEKIAESRDTFQEVVSHLTHNTVHFDSELFETIYEWVDKPFGDVQKVRTDPQEEYDSWPEWKKEAFDKIVNDETLDMFRQHGYTL